MTRSRLWGSVFLSTEMTSLRAVRTVSLELALWTRKMSWRRLGGDEAYKRDFVLQQVGSRQRVVPSYYDRVRIGQ